MFLPKLISIVLLVISLAMLVPLGLAVDRIANGVAVPSPHWIVPLVIMATAAVMMWMLTRKAISLNLFLMAFSLWLVTAGYFFYVTQLR
jgi:hypothetical protein